MRELVTLGLAESGMPTSMAWAGVTYNVTDTPTRLEDELTFVTHPPACEFGWRFQGRPTDGDNRIFDVWFDRVLGGWLFTRSYS